MPEVIYLKLKGKDSKDIEGSCIENKHEKFIEVMSFSHGVSSPYDPYSATSAAGTRHHQSFSLYKALDKSSPLLMQALITGDPMSEFTLELWRNNQGVMEQYYTIKLEKAKVISISTQSHTESIAFVFDKITWTWLPGGNVEAVDTLKDLNQK
jgi:type VI secretion system secreted protein Hcp